MDKNPDLQKQANPGEIAIKGTKQPDITTEPVAPAWVDKVDRPVDKDSFGRSRLYESGKEPRDLDPSE